MGRDHVRLVRGSGVASEPTSVRRKKESRRDAERRLAEAERRVETLLQMLDRLPVNVMTCDPADFRIDYVNRMGLKTLARLEHLLPVKADRIRGQCIDIFHKEPMRIRQLLGDSTNLPHQAQIRIGDEVLELLASPIFDREGNYVRAMVTWTIVTKWAKGKEES